MRQSARVFLFVLMGLASLVASIVAASIDEPVIHVYKLASCGCCRPWIKYMESEGFRVQSTDVPDVHPMKRERGIPVKYDACHTAIVDGYVLEGHVSADDVRRLLKERSPIVGLLVPGMPKGAPGIEGPDAVAYEVLALEKNGSVSVYTTHQPPPPESPLEATESAAFPSAEPAATPTMVEPH